MTTNKQRLELDIDELKTLWYALDNKWLELYEKRAKTSEENKANFTRLMDNNRLLANKAGRAIIKLGGF